MAEIHAMEPIFALKAPTAAAQDPAPQSSQPPAHSQASSHFPLAPISGAVLFAREVARRDSLVFGTPEVASRGSLRRPGTGAENEAEKKRRRGRKEGNIRVGCGEVDQQVLLGGFERGCVVGVSAEAVDGEDMELGLMLALQTIARHLVQQAFISKSTGKNGPARQPGTVRIITTMAGTALLPAVKKAIEAQLAEVQATRDEDDPAGDNPVGDSKTATRRCLERISISRVFEFEGLWEVLSELEQEAAEVEVGDPLEKEGTESVDGEGVEADDVEMRSDEEHQESMEDVSPDEPDPPSPMKSEIQDSEDEGLFSSPPAPEPSSPPVSSNIGSHQPPLPPSIGSPVTQVGSSAPPASTANTPPQPEIILVTNIADLLSSLFRGRDKPTAHTMLKLLSSRLQYISRAPEHCGPLIMLLNTTNNPSPSHAPTLPNPSHQLNPDTTMPPPRQPQQKPSRLMEPTLRSIFNPPPRETLGYYPTTGGGDTLSRRNKPTFGLLFTQMLDLHLLCTRVPRSREDAEAGFAPMGTPGAGLNREVGVRYVWVVECLLDEMGVWEGYAENAEGQSKRKSREQRWGAVDVVGGVIKDAFAKRETVNTGAVRLAAGFGGRRV